MDENKKGAKLIFSRIIFVIIVTIFIMYLIYNAVKLIIKPTDTFVVEQGVVDMKDTVDAYVIRNEIVLQGNNYKNGMEKVITEGKRVAKGESVFRYYVNGEQTIKNQISELDKQIEEAQKNEKVIYDTDIEVLKEKIKNLEDKIYDSNNLEEIKNYEKEINDYTYKISTIVGDSSQQGSYLKSLIDKKTEYLNKLTDGAEDIKTPESGTVSYRIDNMENLFTTNDFSYLTKDFLDGLNLKSGELIETSSEKGKIITDFNLYLAMEMDSESAMNAKIDDKVTLRIGMDTEVSAKIVHINENDGYRIIVFKVNDLPDKLINYRKVSIDVIWWQYTGLKIPKSALIEEDGKFYVMRNRGGYTAKVLVKVLNQNDSYSIVDNYTIQELQEMGYSYDEIRNMYTIKQYDKIDIKD